MLDIEQAISPFVESMFPEFYRTEGDNFIAFVKAYYTWLETSFQLLEMRDGEGFAVGDKISQWQSPEVTSYGTIYAIEDNYFLVQLDSFDPFRCEVNCNILTDVVNQDGKIAHVLEQRKVNPIYGARNLFKFRDVDTTIDSLIIHFKEKYLKNIQFNVATNKKLLIKNSLDLYRSKGTERSIDLFFKLVYNKNAEVYYPGDDIFRLSDGDWYVPQYLEISNSERANDFVGKTIQGLSSGSTAFVERFIKRRIETGYIYLLFLSNIVGNFTRGEALKSDIVHPDAPKVLGSLNHLEIISSGTGYSVGDIVDVKDKYGQFGKARVTSVESTTGEVEFIFIDGGYGYTVEPVKYLSDKILTISALTSSNTYYFEPLDSFSQGAANLVLASITSNNLIQEDELYSYHGNGDIKAEGIVLSINTAPIIDVSANTSNADILVLTSGTTSVVAVGDLIVGSTNKAVVNTDISSRVTSIINTTAFEVNTSIVVSDGTAQVATSAIGQVGEIYVYMVDGEFEPGLVYTSGNTVTLEVGNVTNKSVYGKVLKEPSIYSLSVDNSSGTYLVGEQVYQLSGSTEVANGTIISVSISSGSGSIEIENNRGVWGPDQILSRSGGASDLTGITTTLPIQFDRETKVEVTVDTSVNSTSLLVFTTGTTANLNPGDRLINSSNISVINHNVGSAVREVINSMAVDMDASVIVANGTSIVTFMDITDNDLIVEPFTPAHTEFTSFVIDSVSLGQGAEYGIVNVEPSETVYLNTDFIGGVNEAGIPFLDLPLDAVAYGFSKDPLANSDSFIIEALDFKALQIGTITDVITTNPGNDYTLPPEAVIIEPIISSLELKDYFIEIQEVPGSFKNGDVVTQIVGNTTFTMIETANVLPFISGEVVYQGSSLATSTANGIVYTANVIDSSLYLVDTQGTFSDTVDIKSHVSGASEDVLSITIGTTTNEVARGVISQAILSGNTTLLHVIRKSVPSFVPSTSNVLTTGIITANVITVSEDPDSVQIGLNAIVEANVIIGEGGVSGLEVIDSGFGYPNNAVVEFSSEGKMPGLARASIDNYGQGEGYYRDSKGFLSDDKKIFDGEYYQEYSYEIMSSFSIDKYIEIFMNVMHVAGTKLFGSVVLQETGDLILDVADSEIKPSYLGALTTDNSTITVDDSSITVDTT